MIRWPIMGGLLCLLLVSRCDVRAQQKLSGTLIYAGGMGWIHRLDLASLADSVVHESVEKGYIETLTKVTDDVLIFEESLPFPPRSVLKQLSLTSGTATLLRTGLMPTYVAESDQVFFYDFTRDQEGALFVAKRTVLDTPQEVAAAPRPGSRPPNKPPVGWSGLVTPVVQIAADEVILVGPDHQLWIYHLSTAALTPIGIYDVLPKAWRSQTRQLIYYDDALKGLGQLNLETKERSPLPRLQRVFSGLVYVPLYDILIYSKGRSDLLRLGETNDIFAYHFNTGNRKKLRSHTLIAGGVWFER